MTNAEKFEEVFGTDLKRQYSTKTWWEQEFVPNKIIPTGWIPVSERLPERWQLVNITIKNYDESLLTGVGYYRGSDDGTWFITAGDGEFLVEDEVIAWMPLPEPYKASPTGAEGSEEWRLK